MMLSAQSLRLRAEIEGHPESFAEFRNRDETLIADQLRLLSAARQSYDDEQSILRNRLEQRRLEVEALREQTSSLVDQLAAITEQAQIRTGLFKKGIGSRITLLETERETARIRGALGEARFGLRQAESAALGAGTAIREHRSRWRSEREHELETVMSELNEVHDTVALYQDRVTRLEVRAPVAGTINLLTVAGAGAVVAPGESLMEIVPSDEALMAEVKVAARDVGFLSPGQMADVSISGFDVSRYGSVPGRSGMGVRDKQCRRSGACVLRGAGGAGSDTELSYALDRRRVMPGMSVQASINTGTQSLAELHGAPGRGIPAPGLRGAVRGQPCEIAGDDLLGRGSRDHRDCQRRIALRARPDGPRAG